MADYGREEFRDDWFSEHDADADDARLERLWDELDLYTIMQESASQEDFHERLHDIYDPDSDEYDIRWHDAMDEFLAILGYDELDDIEGWYH